MIGAAEALDWTPPERGRILVVDEQRSSSERIVGALKPYHDVIARERAAARRCEGARGGRSTS